MDQRQITKGMLEFNKSILDSTFNTIRTTQEQTEKMIADIMDKANWLPDDEKKAINNWIESYKKGRNDFKTATEEKYEEVANHFLR